jgi:hypothetical protein
MVVTLNHPDIVPGHVPIQVAICPFEGSSHALSALFQGGIAPVPSYGGMSHRWSVSLPVLRKPDAQAVDPGSLLKVDEAESRSGWTVPANVRKRLMTLKGRGCYQQTAKIRTCVVLNGPEISLLMSFLAEG